MFPPSHGMGLLVTLCPPGHPSPLHAPPFLLWLEYRAQSNDPTGIGGRRSYLLRYLIQKLRAKYGEEGSPVVAPTGIAATNVGGITLHSWAGGPPSVMSTNCVLYLEHVPHSIPALPQPSECVVPTRMPQALGLPRGTPPQSCQRRAITPTRSHDGSQPRSWSSMR